MDTFYAQLYIDLIQLSSKKPSLKKEKASRSFKFFLQQYHVDIEYPRMLTLHFYYQVYV